MKIIIKISIFGFLFFASCNNQKETIPEIKDVKELVFASGQIEWDNAYNLTAQTEGVLQTTNFEVGDSVAKGFLVAIIENKTSDINTQTAIQQLEIANENLSSNAPALLQLEQNIQMALKKYEQDKKLADRYNRLRKENIGTLVEYENMQLNAENSLLALIALQEQKLQILQQAKSQQIAAKGQVQNSQVLQNYNQIVATETGTVIKKFKTKGDYVRKGEVIAVIADEQKAEAVLNVDENNIGKIKKGQTVFVQLNTEKTKIYNAKITQILSAFDEQTQSFICKATFDSPLIPSLFGTQLEANILVGQKRNALLIPREFLGYGNKVNVKGNKQSIIVKTGIVSSDYVEILEGITKEDILVIRH